jgi:hypothetical protein
MTLYQQWLDAKATESEAIAKRREIEDAMVAEFKISEQLDGTENFEREGYKIKIVGRINRRVDSDLLEEIANEHGLYLHLSSLFRWKPEINAAAWKAADKEITAALAPAITAKPGRPSFSITPVETKE